MNTRDLEKELRAEILHQLQKINRKACPNVYERIQNEDGYAEIEERIIYMVANEGLTPSACIGQIESEMSE